MPLLHNFSHFAVEFRTQPPWQERDHCTTSPDGLSSLLITMILETFKHKVEQHQTQCLWERWKHPQQPLKPESRQSEMSHLSRIRREQPQWNSTSTRLKHFHCLLHQQLFTQSQVHAAVHVWYYYVLYVSGKWVHMSFINKIICLLTPLFLVLTVWNSFFFFFKKIHILFIGSCRVLIFKPSLINTSQSF